VYAGWVEALRTLGEKVIEFNLDDRLTFYGSMFRRVGEDKFTQALEPAKSYELAINGLYSTLYKARPDILLVVSGFFISPELLDRVRRSGTRIVIIHTECPYEDERQLKLAPYADLNLVDDTVSLERFAKVAPAMYKPHAYRPSIHHPGLGVPDLECDFAFVGTGYPSRVAFLEAMDFTDLDVLLAGNWQTIGDESPLYPFLAHEPDECLDNDKTADVYRSAKTSLNLYRREAQAPELVAGTAMGPRELEMAACGLFFLRDRRPEGDEVLGMLPTFDSPGEASELLRWFLAHPDERQALADKAREAIADRTFDAQAQQLLRLLDQ
jgi:spore maturation protein CgeB